MSSRHCDGERNAMAGRSTRRFWTSWPPAPRAKSRKRRSQLGSRRSRAASISLPMRRARRNSSAPTVTAASVVVDASALIRAAVEHHPAARLWTHAIETGRARGHVPELVYAELPSVLAQSVRAGLLEARDAGEILDRLLCLPVRRHTQS